MTIADTDREAWMVGTVIPALVLVPDRAEVFMFSAITWNRHRIHYDEAAAVRDGLPDVVVQRGLVGNYLARLLTEWAGDSASLRFLSWKMMRSAVPGRPLTCRGHVAAIDDSSAAVEASCEVEAMTEAGELVATGRATVVRSRRGT